MYQNIIESEIHTLQILKVSKTACVVDFIRTTVAHKFVPHLTADIHLLTLLNIT